MSFYERKTTMSDDQIKMYWMTYGKYFSADKALSIQQTLANMEESKAMMLNVIEYRDPIVVLLLSIFVGYLGIDRFMIQDIGMGLLKLLTGGLCGILVIIDWFIIMDKTKDYNYQKFLEAVMML